MSEQAEVEDRPKRLTRAQRQEMAERLPWVTRLKMPWPCDGIKWGQVALRDLYNWGPGRVNPPRGIQPKARCSKTARWSFKQLKYGGGERFLVGKRRKGVRHYCWDHLISAGMYGSMEEERRTTRWFEKHPVAGAEGEQK